MYTRMVIALLLAAVCIGGAFADSLAGSVAPPSPEFVQYLQDMAQSRAQPSSSKFQLGGVPDPLDLSHLRGMSIFPHIPMPNFDASFDLRNVGKVSPVKNQFSCGSCWTFGAIGSLESCLLPGELWDFSENNLKNTHGFNYACCEGGTRGMSTAYLARWSGPVLEADDPYSDNAGNCYSPPGLPVRGHVQQAIYIPERADAADNNNFKQAILTYGGVCTYFYWHSDYYREDTNAYYYNGSMGANHSVVIIGWDDNYSRHSFRTYPPGDGAWIVKNSWGSEWGANGYFYVSYHDSRFPGSSVVYPMAEPLNNYDSIYQYDPLGFVTSYGYGTDTAWFANVFTAQAAEELAAAAWYTASPGSDYELRIYTGVTTGPTSGTLAATKTGTIATPGYNTISLSAPVTLAAGQKFSLVVRQTTPGYTYPIPIEYPLQGYSTAATASTGQSYVSNDETAWTDLVDDRANTNVCLKAFTRTATPSSILVTTDTVTVPEGGSTQFGVRLSKAPPGNVTVTVAHESGDTDISVQSGATLLFGPTDWNSNKPVTLAAALDADATNGTAIIRCNAPGWSPADVTATESDRDIISGSISAIKSAPLGASVECAGKVVTAVFGSEFYIQEPDRSSGILVVKQGLGLSTGMTASVSGTTARNPNGECYIAADNVTQGASQTAKPLGLSNRSVGGAAFGIQEGTWNWDAGAGVYESCCGANNIGLLVTTCGRITYCGDEFCYIDDGSAVSDGSGHLGLRIDTPGVHPPSEGTFVQVTGISSCFRVGERICRRIRPRSAEDLRAETGSTISGTVTTDYLLVTTMIESPHPYPNNFDGYWVITGPADSTRMRVYFSKIQLEADYDYLYVMDEYYDTYDIWNNDEPIYDTWSEWVPGNILRLNLTTDYSEQRYGFQVTAYEVWTPGTPMEGIILTLTPGNQTTQTGPDGNYSFRNLSAGTYTITPSMQGCIFIPPNQTVTITHGQHLQWADFIRE